MYQIYAKGYFTDGAQPLYRADAYCAYIQQQPDQTRSKYEISNPHL